MKNSLLFVLDEFVFSCYDTTKEGVMMKGKAFNYDSLYQQNKPMWGDSTLDPVLKKYLSLFPKGNVLDLGIGEGQNSIPLSNLGFEVTGVDVSKQALSICQSRCPNLHLVENDIRKFSIASSYYELILVRNVLHFLNKKDIADLVLSIQEGIASGGFVYICVFSTDDPSYLTLKNQSKVQSLGHNEFFLPDRDIYRSFFEKEELLSYFSGWKTILLTESYFLDVTPMGSHYHGVIHYLGQKDANHGITDYR